MKMLRGTVFAAAALALSMCARGGDVLAALDGAAANETRLEAAKARPYKDGFSLDGSEIVCAVGTNAERTCGAGWHVSLKQGEPAAVVVSAEGKVESGNGSGEVQLYIDVTYMDGDHLWGQRRSFPTVPCDWRKRTVVIVPPKPIRSISVYVIAKKGAGLCARFRPPVVSCGRLSHSRRQTSCSAPRARGAVSRGRTMAPRGSGSSRPTM